MKRAYEVSVERGQRYSAYDFVVVASTDEEAVKKAKAEARKKSGLKSDWRCTMLKERETQLVR